MSLPGGKVHQERRNLYVRETSTSMANNALQWDVLTNPSITTASLKMRKGTQTKGYDSISIYMQSHDGLFEILLQQIESFFSSHYFNIHRQICRIYKMCVLLLSLHLAKTNLSASSTSHQDLPWPILKWSLGPPVILVMADEAQQTEIQGPHDEEK